MPCQRCKSDRIASVGAKVSDGLWASVGESEHHGYVPHDMGLGRGGDYLDLDYCLTCGQIQEDEDLGVKFPVPPCKLEAVDDDS